ncbi:MAG: hypothetical protein G01um101431_1041 [Parcubacteria group bacterium Gr01-1014_31]|nr:MAG: hypothetical protein G01um101431_1041 [Parcubacteria group bacterium Gr01-1014_31]
MPQQYSTVLQKIMQEDFLTPREKKILSLRLEGKTLQEVGEEMGVTRERIRQIGLRIKRKLGESLTKPELAAYIVERSRFFRKI